MQKLIDTLKQFGIEIPEEKHTDIKKTLSEHYKNVGEYNKTISKLETERDQWKDKAETAEETLKKFEGIDPENIQKELTDWKQKAETAKTEYEQKIADRDFNDLVKEVIKLAKGKNDKAIMANLDIDTLKSSKNQKEDLKNAIDALKKSEEMSFLFDSEDNTQRAQFVSSANKNHTNKTMTKEEIIAIKDPVARLSQIESNKHLFRKG